MFSRLRAVQHEAKEYLFMKRVTTIVKACLNRDVKATGCGECQASCQSACKTSCTVANQSCRKDQEKR